MATTYVCIDLETTGLTPDCNIIEIGAVKFTDGVIIGKFSTFVACPYSLPPEIVEITGITDSDLKGAPSTEQALKMLKQFIGDSAVLIGYNFGFDMRFLTRHGAKYGISFDYECIDVLKLARRLNAPLPNHRLGTVAEYFGIGFTAHRAYNDAEATVKIFLKLTENN